MNFTLVVAMPAVLLGMVLIFGLPEPVAFWFWIITITAAAVFTMADILSFLSIKLSSNLTQQETEDLKQLLQVGLVTSCAVAVKVFASHL